MREKERERERRIDGHTDRYRETNEEWRIQNLKKIKLNFEFNLLALGSWYKTVQAKKMHHKKKINK